MACKNASTKHMAASAAPAAVSGDEGLLGSCACKLTAGEQKITGEEGQLKCAVKDEEESSILLEQDNGEISDDSIIAFWEQEVRSILLEQHKEEQEPQGPLKCAIKRKEGVTGKERFPTICKAKEAEAFLEQGKGEASEYLDSILSALGQDKEVKLHDSIVASVEQEVRRILLEQHKGEEPQGVLHEEEEDEEEEDEEEGALDEVQARMELYKEIRREYNPDNELDDEFLARLAAQDAWFREEWAKSESRRLLYTESDEENHD